MAKMTDREIDHLIHFYIGVEGGYLGDFDNRQILREFLQIECDLDIEPSYEYPGTIKEEFIEILKSRTAYDQAKILHAVLERFPLSEKNRPQTRIEKLYDKFKKLAANLKASDSLVDNVSPIFTSEVVEQALGDAENLIQTSGPSSAVDRMHTAIHGYLKTVCASNHISYSEADTMNELLKKLQKNHPALSETKHVTNIVNAFRTVLHHLNLIRNQKTLAHANPQLLDESDAKLAINASRTILQYLDSKLSNYPSEIHQEEWDIF